MSEQVNSYFDSNESNDPTFFSKLAALVLISAISLFFGLLPLFW